MGPPILVPVKVEPGSTTVPAAGAPAAADATAAEAASAAFRANPFSAAASSRASPFSAAASSTANNDPIRMTLTVPTALDKFGVFGFTGTLFRNK